MPEFVHIHAHSTFSFFDGAARVEELAEAAKNAGMSAMALTDHGNLHGLPGFDKACRDRGIKPLLGIEAYIVGEGIDVEVAQAVRIKPKKKRTEEEQRQMEGLKSSFHQIIIAKNEVGLNNLHRLISWGSTTGKYGRNPLIDFKRLHDFREGLIVTSSCMQGLISQAVIEGDHEKAVRISTWFKDVFGDDFYFEVHDHGIEKEAAVRAWVSANARRLGIPVLCANDVHYVDPKAGYELQQLKVSNSMRRKVQDGAEYAHEGLHFASGQEMAGMFHAEFPDALDNTLALADKVTVEIPNRPFVLPDTGIADELGAVRERCLSRLDKRYPGPRRAEAISRLEHELATIAAMTKDQGVNFSRYFLIVSGITDYAHDSGILVGPGRGSAAGSIVAYLLGVTNVDPIEYDLLFERFLNPERVSMPDIDIDFDDRRRGEVIDHIVATYGRESVVQICTYGLLKTKAAIKEAGRAYGLPMSTQEALAARAADAVGEKMFDPLWAEDEEVKRLSERDDRVREVVDKAPQIWGWSKSLGVHACGLCITPGPAPDFVPVTKTKSGGADVVVTQYDQNVIEQLGLLKMDILGLRTLSIIMTALEFAKESRGSVVDLNEMPMDDEKVFELFSLGATDGVFQFASTGMKEYLQQLKPSTIEDLIAMNALYRPGPMEHIPTYIKRKHGEERVEYPHELLEPVLRATYGIPVYQEQVMKMAQVIGGFSLGKADILRRGMGKKKKHVVDSLKKEFVDGAAAQGISRSVSEPIWLMMEKFAGYGFNRSHAAAYSILAYQTAYIKAHYPEEFVAATLEHESRDASAKRLFLAMARSMGVRVMPPSINVSSTGFQCREGKVFYGMGQVKHVGEGAVVEIVRERELNGHFTSMEDFAERILCSAKTAVTARAVESLIMVGAMDEFGDRAHLKWELEHWAKWASKVRDWHRGRARTIEHGDRGSHRLGFPTLPAFDDLGPGPKPMLYDEVLKLEMELMGQYVSGSPLDGYHAAIELANNALDWGRSMVNGERYIALAASLDSVKQKTTKAGKPFLIVEGTDMDGDRHELFCWSETIERFGAMIQEGAKLLLLVKPNPMYKDTIEAAVSLSELVVDWPNRMFVEVNREDEAASVLNALPEIDSGPVKTSFIIGGKPFEGPTTWLTPDRLRKIEAIARVELI